VTWLRGEQVLYESMVVLYLMTQLPPLPKIELDDEKAKREKKKQIYGAALVPSVEALCLFKEQLAASKDVLTVRLSRAAASRVPQPAQEPSAFPRQSCDPVRAKPACAKGRVWRAGCEAGGGIWCPQQGEHARAAHEACAAQFSRACGTRHVEWVTGSAQRVHQIIMKWLMEPLLNQGDRTEPETVILDLALNMVRNLLQVDAPLDERGERFPIPASLKARLRSAQDALILKFAEENVMEMLLVLVQSVEEDENRNWNLLLMDIFALLFVRSPAAPRADVRAEARGRGACCWRVRRQGVRLRRARRLAASQP